MKKYLTILFVMILIMGCGRVAQKKDVLAKINNYEITLEEFNQEFADSKYGAENTPESRKMFLDSLINRKLILQEAQAKNLDKGKTFLKMIEKFWEQSLFKLALDDKSKEVVGTVGVTDMEVKDAYSRMLQAVQADRPYEQMYDRIKWELANKKQAQALDQWIDGLREKSKIQVNYDLLKKIDKEGAK